VSKRIPIKDVKAMCVKCGFTHCVAYGYDGYNEFVATYGKTIEQCDEAARAGNWIKKQLGWKKFIDTEPSRVKALKNKIKELEAMLHSRNARIIELEDRLEEEWDVHGWIGG